MDNVKQVIRRILTAGTLAVIITVLVQFDFGRPVTELWQQSVEELYFNWTFATFVAYVKTLILGMLIYRGWSWHCRQLEALEGELNDHRVIIGVLDQEAEGPVAKAVKAAMEAHQAKTAQLDDESSSGQAKRGHKGRMQVLDREVGRAFALFEQLRSAAENLKFKLPKVVVNYPQ